MLEIIAKLKGLIVPSEIRPSVKATVLEAEEEEEEEEPDSGRKPSKPSKSKKMVTIPLSQLKKTEKDRDNYRDAALAAKRKLKGQKGRPSRSQSLPSNDTPKDKGKGDDFVTRKEFKAEKETEKQARIERRAIDIMEADKKIGTELSENFDDIMVHYAPRHGKDSLEALKANIRDAHALWSHYNPSKTTEQKKKDKLKKKKADLKKDKGVSPGNRKEGDEKPPKSGRTFIQKRTTLRDMMGLPAEDKK